MPTWGSPDGFLELQQRNGIIAVHPGGTADIQRVQHGAPHRRSAASPARPAGTVRLGMDLALTESQEMLRASARTLRRARGADPHAGRGLQKQESSLVPELWRKAVELGWPGMLVPTEYGGSESTLTDAAVLFEELGRGPVPGPFFSSGVLGALTMLEAGSEAQRQAILPAVAARRGGAGRRHHGAEHLVGPAGGDAAAAAASAIATGWTASSSS